MRERRGNERKKGWSEEEEWCLRKSKREGVREGGGEGCGEETEI